MLIIPLAPMDSCDLLYSFTIEGIARLDYELKVMNILEYELPEEGRIIRVDAITILLLCHVPMNHVHEL